MKKLKRGDSIKVKSGVMDPDYNKFDLSGWQGRITDLYHEEQEELIQIDWDSITLIQMPPDFIKSVMSDRNEYSTMCLLVNEVEATPARDNKRDVSIALEKLESAYRKLQWEEEEEMIKKILPERKLSYSDKTQNIFFRHLKENLEQGVELTGSEDFPWEEKYVLGGWSKKEYAEEKKTKPSYTDKYEFLKLNDEMDQWYGIMTKVKRKSDGKLFKLPLHDLRCVHDDSPNELLLKAYSFWRTNY